MKIYLNGGGVYISEMWFGDSRQDCCERWLFRKQKYKIPYLVRSGIQTRDLLHPDQESDL